MNHLLLLIQDWRLYGGVLIAFGFAPGFVLRLALWLYPSEDERRAELPAELYSLPRWRRPMWVMEQLETAIFEGPNERRLKRGARWLPSTALGALLLGLLQRVDRRSTHKRWTELNELDSEGIEVLIKYGGYGSPDDGETVVLVGAASPRVTSAVRFVRDDAGRWSAQTRPLGRWERRRARRRLQGHG